jgi:hypothetical protein
MKIVRALVEDYYDIQDMRIEADGQIRAHKQGMSEQDAEVVKEMVSKRLHNIEDDIKKYITKVMKDDPVYKYLSGIKGIGPLLAAGLLAWIEDIEKFETISKLWAYSGLTVSEDGRARKRKKGEKLNWNPRMKTLAWKIGESFVKTKGGYRALYEKFRAEYDAKWKTGDDCGSETCKKNDNKCYDMHRYMAAKRKTVKVFLAHLHMKWSEMKGLPESHPFIIGREDDKGHTHTHEIPVILE